MQTFINWYRFTTDVNIKGIPTVRNPYKKTFIVKQTLVRQGKNVVKQLRLSARYRHK
jgi:hypothetical protein